MKLQRVYKDLVQTLGTLSFGAPVHTVYNPLEYARAPHTAYLRRAQGKGQVLLLGMNPGPFGMAQTGVPFGEVAHVRDWLEITGRVRKPEVEHEKRPIEGFRCSRSEVSGRRLWGWAKSHYATPDRFFRRFFVANYCPLVFMEETGRNRTPDKLPASEREPLFEACDRALVGLVEVLQPKMVVGVGAFAERRAAVALAEQGIRIGRVLHPSPASPAANRGWSEQAMRDFEALGLQI